MDLIITLAVLASGALHGFTFSALLIKVFGLHTHNPFAPQRINNLEQKASLLMGNTIIITFIVISNVAWTDHFENPMKVYAGMGLIVGCIVFVGAAIGKLLGPFYVKSE